MSIDNVPQSVNELGKYFTGLQEIVTKTIDQGTEQAQQDLIEEIESKINQIDRLEQYIQYYQDSNELNDEQEFELGAYQYNCRNFRNFSNDFIYSIRIKM